MAGRKAGRLNGRARTAPGRPSRGTRPFGGSMGTREDLTLYAVRRVQVCATGEFRRLPFLVGLRSPPLEGSTFLGFERGVVQESSPPEPSS